MRIFRRAGEREVTLGFVCEGRFIGAYDAWATRTPARYALETLEPSLVVRFDRACFRARAILTRVKARAAAAG